MSQAIYLYSDARWRPMSPQLLRKRHEFGVERWRHCLEMAGQQPGKRLTLRDISRLISAVPLAEAYNHALLSYQNLVREQLGSDADPARVARLPLHPLFSAPLIPPGSYPLLADSCRDHLYLLPSFHRRPPEQRRLLCGIASRTHTLSMPMVSFHGFALEHYDAIAYFYDPDKNFYHGRQEQLASAIRSLMELLQISRGAFVGTSAGASMAIKMALSHIGSRAVAGSPVLKQEPLLADHLARADPRQDLRDIRITWGRNPTDLHSRAQFEALSEPCLTPPVAFDMSAISPSHGSLGIAALNGLLPRLLHWASDPSCTHP